MRLIKAPTLCRCGVARLAVTDLEQSAFTRAFRHWTGVAPLQWRRRHT